MTLAARRSRVVASLIDRIAVPTVAVNAVFLGAAAFGIDPFDHQPYAWIAAILVASTGVNEVLGTARWGKTVGKRFMGIRVVSVERLEPPGWWRALVRAVGLIPFGWSIRLGGPAGDAAEYGAMAPSPNQQALHDLYAGTIVVDDDSWRAYRARHAVHGP